MNEILFRSIKKAERERPDKITEDDELYSNFALVSSQAVSLAKRYFVNVISKINKYLALLLIAIFAISLSSCTVSKPQPQENDNSNVHQGDEIHKVLYIKVEPVIHDGYWIADKETIKIKGRFPKKSLQVKVPDPFSIDTARGNVKIVFEDADKDGITDTAIISKLYYDDKAFKRYKNAEIPLELIVENDSGSPIIHKIKYKYENSLLNYFKACVRVETPLEKTADGEDQFRYDMVNLYKYFNVPILDGYRVKIRLELYYEKNYYTLSNGFLKKRGIKLKYSIGKDGDGAFPWVIEPEDFYNVYTFPSTITLSIDGAPIGEINLVKPYSKVTLVDHPKDHKIDILYKGFIFDKVSDDLGNIVLEFLGEEYKLPKAIEGNITVDEPKIKLFHDDDVFLKIKLKYKDNSKKDEVYFEKKFSDAGFPSKNNVVAPISLKYGFFLFDLLNKESDFYSYVYSNESTANIYIIPVKYISIRSYPYEILTYQPKKPELGKDNLAIQFASLSGEGEWTNLSFHPRSAYEFTLDDLDTLDVSELRAYLKKYFDESDVSTISKVSLAIEPEITTDGFYTNMYVGTKIKGEIEGKIKDPTQIRIFTDLGETYDNELGPVLGFYKDYQGNYKMYYFDLSPIARGESPINLSDDFDGRGLPLKVNELNLEDYDNDGIIDKITFDAEILVTDYNKDPRVIEHVLKYNLGYFINGKTIEARIPIKKGYEDNNIWYKKTITDQGLLSSAKYYIIAEDELFEHESRDVMHGLQEGVDFKDRKRVYIVSNDNQLIDKIRKYDRVAIIPVVNVNDTEIPLNRFFFTKFLSLADPSVRVSQYFGFVSENKKDELDFGYNQLCKWPIESDNSVECFFWFEQNHDSVEDFGDGLDLGIYGHVTVNSNGKIYDFNVEKELGKIRILDSDYIFDIGFGRYDGKFKIRDRLFSPDVIENNTHTPSLFIGDFVKESNTSTMLYDTDVNESEHAYVFEDSFPFIIEPINQDKYVIGFQPSVHYPEYKKGLNLNYGSIEDLSTFVYNNYFTINIAYPKQDKYKDEGIIPLAVFAKAIEDNADILNATVYATGTELNIKANNEISIPVVKSYYLLKKPYLDYQHFEQMDYNINENDLNYLGTWQLSSGETGVIVIPSVNDTDKFEKLKRFFDQEIPVVFK